jgi:hypothetical protein
VVEFLAAWRLDTMLAKGASIKVIKRLFFAETAQGEAVVRPSMSPVPAWLATTQLTIFDALLRLDREWSWITAILNGYRSLSGAARLRRMSTDTA